jgi:capsular polysaccharide biosynthesis protein
MPSVEQHITLYDALIDRFRGREKPRAPHQTATLPLSLIGKRGLLRVDEALVLSGEWQFIADGKLVMDAYVVQPAPPRSAYLYGINASHAQVFLESPREHVIEDAFLFGGSTNYAHWLLDSLPRLSMLDDATRTLAKAPRLLLNTHRALFQDDSLGLLGIDPRQYLPLDYPGVFRCKNLLVPSLGSGSGSSPLVLQPAVTTWLRDKFLPMVSPSNKARRLFISRKSDGPGKARLVNHNAVTDAAAKLGFEVVTLTGMTFLEQVRLFAEASIVTGPHGAGFANMVFAPPGATLIELMGPVVNRTFGPERFYQRLSAVCGHRYARVVGQPVEPNKTDPLHPSTEQYRIEPASLLNALANILSQGTPS